MVAKPFLVPPQFLPARKQGGLNAVHLCLHCPELPQPHKQGRWATLALWLGREDHVALSHIFKQLSMVELPQLIEGLEVNEQPIVSKWVLDLHAIIQLLGAPPVTAPQCCPYCTASRDDWRAPYEWFGEDPHLKTFLDHPHSLIKLADLGTQVIYDSGHMLPQLAHNLLAALWYKHVALGDTEALALFLQRDCRWFKVPETAKRLGKRREKGKGAPSEVEATWKLCKKSLRQHAWWEALAEATLPLQVREY